MLLMPRRERRDPPSPPFFIFGANCATVSGMLSRRAILAAAPFVVTSAKGAEPKPIMGAGEFRYEVTHDCLQLPPQLRFGNTHGIQIDSQGRIFVAHTVHKSSGSQDAIAIFDPQGRFIRSWGADLRGGAHGLTLRREGKDGKDEFLYICDNVKGTVRKTTLDGDIVWMLSAPYESGVYRYAKEFRPSNVAFAPNGDMYVADGYGKFYIHQYDSRTRYIRTFGGSREEMDAHKGEATKAGTTIWPHAIAVDTRKRRARLMVGERGDNSRVQYFTLDGKAMESFQQGVRWPSTFSFRDSLMLMPDLKAVVTLYNGNNQPVAVLGDGRQPDGKSYEGIRNATDRSAYPAGRFIAPHDACFDEVGNIYVAEWVELGRVSFLRKV
jgi:hypothetical protein